MSEIPKQIESSKLGKKIREIKDMSSNDLQNLIIKELQRMPTNDRLAFESVSRIPWSEIVQEYSSLSGKSYSELKNIREPLEKLGDLSGSEVKEITTIVIFNEQYYKDPKVEMYLILKLIETRFISRFLDRLRRLFK